MRWTFRTFAIGTLALTGCPLLSGFFSKDALLIATYQKSLPIFALALFTAFLTAFYMTRLVVVAFLGKPRTQEAEHGHDGPPAMTVPLLILAVLSVVAGYGFIADRALGPDFSEMIEEIEHRGGAAIVMTLATLAFLVGSAGAWLLYKGAAKDPILIPLFKKKFYFDELYAALIAGTQDVLAATSSWFDRWILDGLIVRGLSSATWGAGFVLRFLQWGNLQGYAFLFGAGVVAFIYLLVFK